MANNYVARDATGVVITKSATDIGSGVEADNVRICDATAANFMPTADAAARALFAQISDASTGPVLVSTTRPGSSAKGLTVRPMMPTNGTQDMPSGDAAARAIVVSLSDGTGIAAFDNSNTTPKVSAYGKGTSAGDTAIPSLDTKGHRGWVQPTDGTNDFLSGTAANNALKTSVNAQLVTAPGNWVATSAPAVNNAASASQSAGGAGVRHVCTSVSFTLSQDTTGGTPFTGTVNLRDGATGAGSVLATWYIGCQTAACSHNSFALSGLNIVGSAATAMTLEFTAVGGAHTLESCTITGYDCV